MNPLDEGKQALAVKATRKAKRIADWYARFLPQYADDLESAACLGAVRAASTFNPDVSKVWDRWTMLCIHGEVKDFIDSSYLKRRGDECELDNNIEDKHLSSDCELDAQEEFDHLLSKLPERYRRLIDMVYRLGMWPGEAGRALGYTTRHGNKLHNQAIAELRRKLAS